MSELLKTADRSRGRNRGQVDQPAIILSGCADCAPTQLNLFCYGEEDSNPLRGKTMESISPGTLLAIVFLTGLLGGSGFGSCYSSTGSSVANKDQTESAGLSRDFKIKYGQELTVKGEDLKVKFASLLEDSRCPADVKCVWEGDAKILISVRRDNAGESKVVG